MKLLLDNNLSFRFAHALNALVDGDGHEVVHLTDRFPASTPDEVWIAQLGSEGGWAMLSGDQRIFRNRLQREAWRSASVTSFFLAPGWSKLKHMDKASKLITWWPRFVDQFNLVSPGAAFEVPQRATGRLKQLRA